MHPQDFLSIFHAFIFFLLYGSISAQTRRALGRGGNQAVDFDCPEEFGYYPHPTDCTKYYVCVFGGAVLESCTGGLMYSHELQTCDWPRNVGCEESGGDDGGTVSTVRVTDPRTTKTPAPLRTSNSQQSFQSQQDGQLSRSSQREEALRHRQAQQFSQHPEQRPQQIVYEDELGPAEEVESDRQQRVYRGQPSTLGQVQRDRDGLRPLKGAALSPNVIPSGPGTVEKVSLVTYGGPRNPEPGHQDQYSFDLYVDNNFTTNIHSRFKRQTVYRADSQSRGTQKLRRVPIILIPDKAHSNSRPSYPTYKDYSHPHLATSYSSQNNENYRVVHHYGTNVDNQSPLSRPHWLKPSSDRPTHNRYSSSDKYIRILPRPQNNQVVHIGYDSLETFNPQDLFIPAKNSRPELDIVKLSKETIQTEFRPVRPSTIFKVETTSRLNPQEAVTPRRPSETAITVRPASYLSNHRAVTSAPSTTVSPVTLEDSQKLTQTPMFEAATTGKRKRKKSTTPSTPIYQPPTTDKHLFEPFFVPATSERPATIFKEEHLSSMLSKTFSSTTQLPKEIQNKPAKSPPPYLNNTPKKHISEEYFENFVPFQTTTPAPPISSTYGKRHRMRPRPSTATTSDDNKTTQMTLTSPKDVWVEPEPEIVVTTPLSPIRYNATARYQPSQYDPYYPVYEQDQEGDVYRGNKYSQQFVSQQEPEPQLAISSTPRSPSQYRGQSTYKQQSVQIDQERDSYTPDIYDQGVQDYNDQDEQQFQHLTSPKPNRSTDGVQEPSRRDTLSEASIARPLVTNHTVKRENTFDPSILVPPPKSPSIFLTPPNEQQSYYQTSNKPHLIPPKNGGVIARTLHDFTSVLSSFFRQADQSKKDFAPQTILRSEIGHIRHDISASSVEKEKLKSPVAYQELPERDVHTFFVEIEPKKNQPKGFIMTRPPPIQSSPLPPSSKEEPVVEITREMLINPESGEIISLAKNPSSEESRTQQVPSEIRQAVGPNVNLLPLRAPPEKFNPYIQELDFFNYYRQVSSTTPKFTTTTPSRTTTSTTTERPRLQKSHVSPYQFIIVSTEIPTGFTRNPLNENRSNRFKVRPEAISRKPLPDSFADTEKPPKKVSDSSQEQQARFSSRYSTTQVPVVEENRMESEEDKSNEATEEVKQTTTPKTTLSSGEDYDENQSLNPRSTTLNPSSAERTRLYSSEEDERPQARTRTRNGNDVPVYNSHRSRSRGNTRKTNDESKSSPAVNEDSFEESSHAPVRQKTVIESSAETTEKTQYYSSQQDVTPTRFDEQTAHEKTAPTIPQIISTTEPSTTKKPTVRIRTTSPIVPDYRKTARKIIKVNRGELSNQRLAGSKVKRVRKPSTQSPVYTEEKSHKDENEVFSTIRPIFSEEDLSAEKNVTYFRFTAERDYADAPQKKEEFLITVSTPQTFPQVEDEKRVVRPAYRPINLDTLDSAEEPIPPRPSVEPPTNKPSPARNPDHDRTTAKPSRGRSSLKPRLRAPASPDSQPSATPNPSIRQRGGSSKSSGESNEFLYRATPSPSRGTRPTLKPSTSIVSQASDFIDVYKYPPRRPQNLYPTPIPDKSAAKCRKDVCLLPDCSCGGKDIPGGLSPEETPQLVLLTFDDSVNDLNKGLYADLFERGRVNPNGCPISATFYVSHEWTDYSQVQNLYATGHEIASHSVSHGFGEQFSQKKWFREIAGQREILAAYGGVRLEDVRGMRAPFLAVGGNKMFKMLHDANFTYDSSMPIYENKPPSWPYTLDYKLFHDCMIPPCPTKSYPGVWEVPMVMWQDLNGGRCSMGDACSNPPTADGVYKMLIKNFERHFTSNRAPFGLFYHAAWFTHEHHKEGFIAFLDTIVNMPEVWLVTNWQAIQWIRDPQPISRVNNFAPFQCNEKKANKCNNPKVCNLWHKSGVRYMRTCQPCPDIYPWTGKTGIRNSRVDNEIIDE